MKIDGMLPILAPPEALMAHLRDPDTLRRILPGCEGVDPDGPDRFRARIARKVGLLTLRVEPEIALFPAGDGRHVLLTLEAASRMAGAVAARLTLRMDREPLGTRLFWEGEVTTGGLAARLLSDRADQVAPRVTALFQRLKSVAEGR
jgi:carbon monoxide dehydrogenase subunit G